MQTAKSSNVTEANFQHYFKELFEKLRFLRSKSPLQGDRGKTKASYEASALRFVDWSIPVLNFSIAVGIE
jgi:hypothetical protein